MAAAAGVAREIDLNQTAATRSMLST
jgi:hypothetical protein